MCALFLDFNIQQYGGLKMGQILKEAPIFQDNFHYDLTRSVRPNLEMVNHVPIKNNIVSIVRLNTFFQ